MGTPKNHLKRCQAELLDQADWHALREGLEVKRVSSPEGPERFSLCRSTDRAAKESAMLKRQMDRLRAQFEKLDRRLREHPVMDIGPVAGALSGRRGGLHGRTRIRYRTESLKLVQVYATDKKGKAVDDLRLEDFVLTVDGRPVAITAFEKRQ
ncbi:MAG: hypothetical protein FJY82_15400, partial [Candidatus Aminicenantes bacterium]|nr:hypothetical protein [Candidatus Aminicenantes bacterium]